MDISSLNHNDIIIANGINTLNSRINDNYTLLYDNFSPAEKIAYALAGTQFINTIASLIEAYMIMNLRTRMSNVETWDNEIEALYNWIDYSNLNRLGCATTTPISKLSDLYVLRSNIILSNRTAVLENTDRLETVNHANTMFLKYSHLKTPNVEGPQLDNGTRWIMTRQELIDFLKSKQQKNN